MAVQVIFVAVDLVYCKREMVNFTIYPTVFMINLVDTSLLN